MQGSRKDHEHVVNLKQVALINADGKLAYIPGSLFYQLCVVNDHCFLCLERKPNSERNKEHVIPDWFLGFRGLKNRYILSASGSKRLYSRYTIDCCKVCNTYLSEVFEKKISEIIKSQGPEVSEDLIKEDYVFLHQWLCLIQAKFFICDAKQGLPSKANPPSYLSDLSLWDGVSHIANIARSKFAEVEINPDTIGSVFICARSHEDDNANIVVLEEPRAMLLRAGRFALISVPCDGSYGAKLHRDFIRSIRGKLTGLQLIELLCRYAAAHACMPSAINHITTLDGVITSSEQISLSPPSYGELKKKYGELMARVLDKYGLFEKFADIDYLSVRAGEFSSFQSSSQRMLPGC